VRRLDRAGEWQRGRAGESSLERAGAVIARLTRLAVGAPRRMLLAAAALFALAAALGAPVTGMLGSGSQDFQDPASQFERANAAITAATGQTAYYNVAALLRGGRDIRHDPGARRATETLATLLAGERGFQRLLDYPSSRLPALLSRDGRETVVLAAFATTPEATAASRRVRALVSGPAGRARLAGMSARFGGEGVTSNELNERTIHDLERAELLGLPFLLVLSFWFFRGIVAALLPPLVGGLAILITFLALRVVDQFVPVSVFALNLVSGMGLGLGIDYSLFVLYRYREELAGGSTAGEAIERTLRTVGRTVLFSSVTVSAAMLSLLVFPLRFLYSMGIGGAIVAVCDGAVALGLLPALLIALGPRINALSPAWLQRRAARTARATQHGGWWRLAHAVVRRPAPVALAGTGVLLAAAIPALHVQFAPPSANLLPSAAESRQVEKTLARDFSSNVPEAAEIVFTGTRPQALALAGAAARAAGRLASASPPVRLGGPVPGRADQNTPGRLSQPAPGRIGESAPGRQGRGTWMIVLSPHGSPFTRAQQRLLARLRALGRPYRALVGGATAFFVDQKAAISSHIPLALLILVPLTAGFLFLMTGSLTIPAKALAMNVLSVSVAVGLQVVIFQDGHLSGLLGFTPVGGLEESSLVLMLVLAFALATDYEVFVLGRIKEAHDDGLDNQAAIALGVERTGRIVTAAALLFCVAIGALVTSQLFFTKQLGLGAALAVAVDASIVRALLVPSLMALMGDWNWWAPGPLRRLHDRIALRELGADTARSAAGIRS
jgi:uncharacterized membrane protein YdfJ with MMPL/SSD domain